MQGIPMQSFMQGMQPARVVFAGNPFMPTVGPQYLAVPPVQPQAPPLVQFPGPADQPWFQALVAAVSKAVVKDIEKLNRSAAAPPEKLSPENEKILIDALKKGKEDELSMDRIFQELCKKHGYTEDVWMKWFATNVDKLYPKMAPPKANVAPAPGREDAGGPSRPRGQAPPAPHSASNNRPTRVFRFVPELPHPRSRKVVIETTTTKSSTNGTQGKPTTTSSVRPGPASLSSGNASSLAGSSSKPPSRNRPPPVLAPHSVPYPAVPTPYSANRSRRGGSVRIDHDQTLIPWSDGSIKPSTPRTSESASKLRLPRRTSQTSGTGGSAEPGSGSNSKFTDAEKIFFIHWLRWRLHEGPLPDKETLFEELEEELPHRTAEMWKKHWSSNCGVPDALYIQARKRAESAADARGGSTSPLTPLATAGEGRSSSESESQSGSESQSESQFEGESKSKGESSSADEAIGNGNASPARKPAATTRRTNAKVGRRKRKPAIRFGPPAGEPVTDEDLRAMARFRFGKGALWKKLGDKPRWREFAERPENAKRSVDGWRSITKYSKHAATIDRYVNELEQHTTATGVQSPAQVLQSSNLSLKSKAAPGSGASHDEQNRPAPLTSSSGTAKQLRSSDAKPATASPASLLPQKRAGAATTEAVDAGGTGEGTGKELPPPKRKKPSWDVNPADVVDLTGED